MVEVMLIALLMLLLDLSVDRLIEGLSVYVGNSASNLIPWSYGLHRWLCGKGSACHCRRCRRHGFDPWAGKIPWRRTWQPTPIFLPGEFHGWRSLVGYSTWGRKESDTTERLHFTYWSGLPFPPPGDVSDVSCTSCTGRWILHQMCHLEPPGKSLNGWFFSFVCLVDSSKLESLGATSLKGKTNGVYDWTKHTWNFPSSRETIK